MKQRLIMSTALAYVLLAGCATNETTGNYELNRAGVGAAVGAVAGVAVGAAVGDSTTVIRGALIGAGTGAGAGYVWDRRHKDLEERLAEADIRVEHAHNEHGEPLLVLTAPADLYFRMGSSDMASEGFAGLYALAQALKGQSFRMGIVGHSDNSESAAGNDQLSYQRAYSVASYLHGTGIPADKLFVRGAGSHEPLADNATPQGRAMNRRVEILLSKG